VETARELGATRVVGVYVGQQQPAKREKYRTSLDVVRRVNEITTKASDNLQLCRSDLAISMDVRADMFDFDKGEEAMRQGEQAALQNIDRLRSLWGEAGLGRCRKNPALVLQQPALAVESASVAGE